MTWGELLGLVIFIAGCAGVYNFYKTQRGRKTDVSGKPGAPKEDGKK